MLVKMSQAVPTKKIAFDSFTDIKSEIGPLTVKAEPKWELEVDLNNSVKPVESIEGKDIVIANTVIRKVDGTEEQKEESKSDICSDTVDLTWSSNKSKTQSNDYDVSLLDYCMGQC